MAGVGDGIHVPLDDGPGGKRSESVQPTAAPALAVVTGAEDDGALLHGDDDAVLGLGRPMTSRTAAAQGLLTVDLIITRLGVYDMMAMKELILRDEGLVGVHRACAQSLVGLEILSLSHNRLTAIEGFEFLTNLVELNLNFNQLTSIEYLQCPGLEKLFLSNNKLTDISPVKGLGKLNTLSLYGNFIADLDMSLHVCRSLPKLRSLDLGGNPCTQETEGYKFQVIRSLPRLKNLDGEQVTQLDKELAEEYVLQGKPSTPVDARPLSSAGRPLTSGGRPLTAGGTPSKPFDPFSSKLMPKGNVRLFRDDFLNNNSILLEYLAQEAQEAPYSDDTFETPTTDDPTSATSGFVEKMRNANPLGDVETAEEDGNHSSQTTEGEPLVIFNRDQRPLTANTIMATSHLSVDPSDPKTTIRKLLKHIELLEESLASYTSRHSETSESALIEENRRLLIENNNIPILQEEVTNLKKRITFLTTSPCPPPTSIHLSADSKRVNELEQENETLRRENTRLKQLLKGNEVSASEPTRAPQLSHYNSGTEDNGGHLGHIQSKRLSNSSLLEDCASIDVELTELILQNEVSLELIRNDIKNTRREWEDEFRKARDREQERQRTRPQTSLGLLSTNGSTNGISSNRGSTSATSVPKGGPLPTQIPTKDARSRQLHTSAGFHHGGPEAKHLHVLSSGTTTSGAGSTRSVTNILTL